MSDVVIRAGRVVCPLSGIDGPGSVSIQRNRIQSVKLRPTESRQSSAAPPLSASRDSAGASSSDNEDAEREPDFDFPHGVLLPGLIDLHAHPANAGSVFGVPPDKAILGRGVTTVMSQGDAGSGNVDAYIATTIRESETRVLLAINLSRVGESTERGCFEDLDDADVDQCVLAIDRHREFIPAIAVNVSHNACGQTDPREIFRRGLEASRQSGLPILFGMRRPEDWPLDDQLRQLRAGDVVTYCFRQEPHCIVQHGDVLQCVRDAQQRGVLFDVGHGTASFSFPVAETAIRMGFLPDTISTDLQSRHLDQESVHDLASVLTKLVAAGMPETRAFGAVTSVPARALGLSGVGKLVPGDCADLVVLRRQAEQLLSDTHSNSRTAARYSPQLVVRNGKVQDFANN